MMYDKIAPLEPTSAPVTINKSLDSIKPAAAAAQPEYEFSIDTTTGISAPPMEATKCQPNASAMAVITIRANQLPLALTNTNISTNDTNSAARFSLCLCGNLSGLLLILPLSLPKATSEPVNVTAPIKMPRNTSTKWMVCISSATLPASIKLLKPTNTAAKPTKLCSKAMSSGISVISTFLAL